MTAQYLETTTIQTISTSRSRTAITATEIKLRVQFCLFLLIGCFNLIKGLSLAMSGAPTAALIGFGLLVPVPSCFYFAWRSRNPQAERSAHRG